MNRVILIIVIILIAIAITIVVIGNKKSEVVPEIVTDDEAGIQARSLANYAVQYGIKQLLQGKVSFADSTHGYIEGFTSLAIMDGTIDSLSYATLSDGKIKIDSWVSYDVLGSIKSHHSSAKFAFFTGEGVVSNITAAIVTGGSITVKAKAVVDGIVIEDSTFDFEETFGLTEQEVKDECISLGSYIEVPANNEPMPDSLTWMNNDLRVQSYWSGAGILIVNGDFNATAQIVFEGILVVFGELSLGAHSDITGAVYVIDDASLGAHAVVSFDVDAIQDALEALPISITLKIVEWNEE
ncbi:MAG: hypothetical protein JW794_05245 [Candidatus Cloacimonetes bacterium]|nr:hypothetical protein [Candidatus Cloacimonadota bacterium]